MNHRVGDGRHDGRGHADLRQEGLEPEPIQQDAYFSTTPRVGAHHRPANPQFGGWRRDGLPIRMALPPLGMESPDRRAGRGYLLRLSTAIASRNAASTRHSTPVIGTSTEIEAGSKNAPTPPRGPLDGSSAKLCRFFSSDSRTLQ